MKQVIEFHNLESLSYSYGGYLKTNCIDDVFSEYEKCKNDIVYFIRRYIGINAGFAGHIVPNVIKTDEDLFNCIANNRAVIVVKTKEYSSFIHNSWLLWRLLFHTGEKIFISSTRTSSLNSSFDFCSYNLNNFDNKIKQPFSTKSGHYGYKITTAHSDLMFSMMLYPSLPSGKEKIVIENADKLSNAVSKELDRNIISSGNDMKHIILISNANDSKSYFSQIAKEQPAPYKVFLGYKNATVN